MQPSRNKSSRNSSRVPFGPVQDLTQVPVAFYEVLNLALEIKDDKARQIETLMKDIIRVTQTGRLSDLPRVAEIQ